MKYVLIVLLAIVAGAAYWLLGGSKWNGYRWDDYQRHTVCVAAKLPDQQGNRIVLPGEGETAAWKHAISIWSCQDGHLLAIYEGLPTIAPRQLYNDDILRYRHGLLGADDSRRFVTPEQVEKLKTIADWNALVFGKAQ